MEMAMFGDIPPVGWHRWLAWALIIALGIGGMLFYFLLHY
jgi:hypothetical protein